MDTLLQSAAFPGTLELQALLRGAAVAPLNEVGWIRVTGSDRVRWLNGMVTNSIQDLKPGDGCYNFVLNAQGRIQGDLTAFLLEDSILLETSRGQIAALLAHFDRFIIMDDVELETIATRSGLLLAGTDAEKVPQKLGMPFDLSELCLAPVSWEGREFTLIHAHSPLIPRWELWSDTGSTTRLLHQMLNSGATLVSLETLEALRILEGTPRYSTDIRNTESAHDLPQETGQTRALHFAKGCYLGQEIVERIRSRGNVHRTFSGFQLTGTLPAAGTTLLAEGKSAGVLTSVAAIPLTSGTVQLALGYIRREALDRSLPIEYPGGTAKPIQLPYEGIA